MRTTLKRGIGRGAVVNGDGRAVLPPGVLSPVTRYQQPEPKRRGFVWSLGRIVFLLLAVVVAVLLGIAGGTYIWEIESLNRTTPVGRFKTASEHLKVPLPNQPTNALIIGYDHRPEDGNGPSRSDTMMLLRADPQGTISMLSFPRDLIVNVQCPDGRSSVGRINSAYFFCGPEGALKTVQNLTGLDIHYLIGVNFEGFRQSVDRLGGVWMDIDQRYYNPHGGVYSTINLWPGYQRLTGGQALSFVRFRHTDSDLFRVARQQQFVKAMKQVMRDRWKDPRNLFKVVGSLTKNMQIGQARGKGISPSTLNSYARFAWELPAGNFFQVKIGGITGTTELHAPTSNIQSAVEQFEHPDVQAPGKATAQALHRRFRSKSGPTPRSTSVVVLNGNGRPGSAANTSYLLGQKGYRMAQPPPGFQANAPRIVHNTKIYFSSQKGARLAAVNIAKLFDLADVNKLPKAGQLPTLSNGAMLTIVVGDTFTGQLTPTPPDQTPPREPARVRPGKSVTLPAIRRAAAWKVGFPLQVPTVIESSSRLDSGVPYSVYRIGKSKAVRLTFVTGDNQYWGIEQTVWGSAPALEDRNFREVIKGRAYDFYYNGPHLHMVVLRAGGATYWVVNTLLDTLSNETMLAIAKGLRPLHK